MGMRVISMIAVALCGAAQAKVDLVTIPARDLVQLTIYNEEDLTLVRENRALTLKEGSNKLQFSWANTLIDPTSLEMLPTHNADKIDIQDLVYPPRVKNLGLWNIDSRVSGRSPVEISYLTSGFSWRAFYMGTLSEDEQTLHLQSYVRIVNNSGEDYENAQVRLVVGRINIIEQIAALAQRQFPYGSPYEVLSRRDAAQMLGKELADTERLVEENMPVDDYFGDFQWGMRGTKLSRKQVLKQGLSEYQLYTIEGRETVPNGWGKRLPSFETHGIGVTNLYKYDEERWGGQTMRFISFANTEEHKLGKTPLPNGRVRVFREADGADSLSYVGGADIKYIPIGEEVELELGAARQVIVEPKLMWLRTKNYEFDRRGNISGWDELTERHVEVTNARKLPVKLEITRATGSKYWNLVHDGIADYEKHDVTHARFTITLPPRTKKTFSYELTTYHGTRQEKF